MIEIVISVVIGAFIGSLVFPIVHNWGLDARLTGVDRRLSAVEGGKGAVKQQAGQERDQMAMMEVMQLIQSGKAPADAIKEVGAKYPDVAMRYLKKLGV